MSDIIIVGAGGLGREVLEIFNAQKKIYGILGFLDDNDILQGTTVAYKIKVVGKVIDGELRCIIAIGNNRTRQEIVSRIKKAEFCNIIHSNVIRPIITSPHIRSIGTDIIIQAGVILTDSSIRIGNHVHIDAGCILSHDVVLQDYVRLNPGVTVCGNVTIEEGAYIGAGATIKEGVRIGSWSTVGMGSVVLNDVPANTTVFGVPAK